MFEINHIQNKELATNYIELQDKSSSSYARIFLNLGGSLQELTLSNKVIIKDLRPIRYEKTFASAILFPFTNRIKHGTYTFKQKTYTLDLNLKEENNALHGLIYNKQFSIISQEASINSATITLSYIETKKAKGFPYNYTVLLTYTLTANSINLNVVIKNNDQNPFPFNVGWHPYFSSSNLYDSFLSLKSNKKLLFNQEMIPVKFEDIFKNKLQIKNQAFDDCFILNNDNVNFKTPDYSINISSSSNENYLQVFTLQKINAIALEPITGPPNSFNNKLSLQILNPDETYKVHWKIKLKEDE